MVGPIDPFILTLTSDEPVLDWFGLTIEEAHDGIAVVTLTVSAEHVNGNRMTHGGVVFAVADQAFAMAANTRAAIRRDGGCQHPVPRIDQGRRRAHRNSTHELP